MSANLSFSDRVALLNKKVSEVSQGELSVHECEGGYIDLVYKKHSLLSIYARGRKEKELLDMISTVFHACVMFDMANVMDDLEQKGIKNDSNRSI